MNSVKWIKRLRPLRQSPFATPRRLAFVGVLGVLLVGACTFLIGQDKGALLVPASKITASATHILEFRFTHDDLQRYRAAYKAEKSKDHRQSQKLLSTVTDTVLVGDVLATRYLKTDYPTSASEIKHWLAHYSELPAAKQMKLLAQRKAPTVAAAAQMPKVRPLTGSGLRDGLFEWQDQDRWREAMDYYQAGRYSKALQTFRAIASRDNLSSWQKSSGHFWMSRCLKAMDLRSASKRELAKAAEYPFTFYGAMAAQMAGHTPRRLQFSRVSPELMQHGNVRRAAAFKALEMPKKAEHELRHLYHQLPLEQRPQLVTLAAALELPALQIRMSQMLYKDPSQSHVSAYPMPEWLGRYDMEMDPALIYAVARQESGFNPAAVSPAGARGIMQLMPQTARYVVDAYRLDEKRSASVDLTRFHQRAPSAQDLADPAINMMIGQHYLRYLAAKPYVNNNLVHLLIAYNAGPANLLKWKKDYAHISDPLLFIEMIPYRETRHYVKQVMANYLIYRGLIHGDASFASVFERQSWPLVASLGSYAQPLQRQFAQSPAIRYQ